MRCISRSELYRQIADGRFPRPVRVGLRAVRWHLNEVEEWIAARPRTNAF